MARIIVIACPAGGMPAAATATPVQRCRDSPAPRIATPLAPLQPRWTARGRGTMCRAATTFWGPSGAFEAARMGVKAAPSLHAFSALGRAVVALQRSATAADRGATGTAATTLDRPRSVDHVPRRYNVLGAERRLRSCPDGRQDSPKSSCLLGSWARR